MNGRPTIEQYRRMAEGLLREALDAPEHRKHEFIQHAAAYLEFARKQDDGSDGTSTAPEHAQDGEDRRRQIRQLIKQALDLPTPKSLVEFLDFTTNLRRLSVWNARMAYIQRPGARVIASDYEWKKVGRYVLPDAVPIIILWPFSPTRFVYELEDTGPPIDRQSISDPFAVKGNFNPGVLSILVESLKKQKVFCVEIEGRRLGFNQAGWAAAHGPASVGQKGEDPWVHGHRIGEFAVQNAQTERHQSGHGILSFRVTFNDRLEDKERFVTIAHELGHIFLGHLGPCTSRPGKDEESGWPDRHSLGKNEAEVEAEAVAYLVASRAGIVAASAQYLKTYATRADMSKVDVDLVVRSAARIERMCKIRYGSMEFKSPSS